MSLGWLGSYPLPSRKRVGTLFLLVGRGFLLFADDVIMFASPSQDLQSALWGFAAKCQVAGIRISISKSEATILDRKKVVCLLQVGRVPASSGGVQVSRGLVHELGECLQ